MSNTHEAVEELLDHLDALTAIVGKIVEAGNFTDLPPMPVGDLDSLTEALDQVEEDVATARNIQSGPGIMVHQTPAGTTVGLAPVVDAGDLAPDLPPGDVESQTLNWDNTNKVWYAGPLRMQ